MTHRHLSSTPAVSSADLSDHPAEAFLRSMEVRYHRCPEDSDVLRFSFGFPAGSARGILQRHDLQHLMMFRISLPQRPIHTRAAHQTAQLCAFLNSNLPVGQFCFDELDRETSFRSGHFYEASGLQSASFGLFFGHCMSSVAHAMPAFTLVTSGQGDAGAGLALVMPPSGS
jgi:hypothetical protein